MAPILDRAARTRFSPAAYRTNPLR